MTVRLQKWRTALHAGSLSRCTEVAAVCVFFSVASFLLLQIGSCMECEPSDPWCSPESRTARGVRIECSGRQYNDMAVLVFNTQPIVIGSLLLTELGEFSFLTLAAHSSLYFVNAVVSYGMAIPSGLFTPSIVFGALMGRLYAHVLHAVGVVDANAGGGGVLRGRPPVHRGDRRHDPGDDQERGPASAGHADADHRQGRCRPLQRIRS
uniref:Chloride transport protein 6-like n=1 Tax=Tetraselmis sp. GSL018 TaxID=582737 RepID=A0A061RU86_9CHLO